MGAALAGSLVISKPWGGEAEDDNAPWWVEHTVLHLMACVRLATRGKRSSCNTRYYEHFKKLSCWAKLLFFVCEAVSVCRTLFSVYIIGYLMLRAKFEPKLITSSSLLSDVAYVLYTPPVEKWCVSTPGTRASDASLQHCHHPNQDNCARRSASIEMHEEEVSG